MIEALSSPEERQIRHSGLKEVPGSGSGITSALFSIVSLRSKPGLKGRSRPFVGIQRLAIVVSIEDGSAGRAWHLDLPVDNWI